MPQTLLQRATQAAAARLQQLTGPQLRWGAKPGYVLEPEANLVSTVRWAELADDYAHGGGHELAGSPGCAKFCAAHSSAALAANTFGPFRRHSERLILAGIGDFTAARFEHTCPTGLQGTSPHLDFAAWKEGCVAAVESKFLEPLTRHTAQFADSYDRVMAREADPCWRRMYESLKEQPRRFCHLDAAQLVKHYLGLRHTYGHTLARIALLYLYWEPTNADAWKVFDLHRREVATFAREVADSKVRFIALSHAALWDAWSREVTWPGIARHVAALKARYAFAIGIA